MKIDPNENVSIEVLLARADAAMYENKQSKRIYADANQNDERQPT